MLWSDQVRTCTFFLTLTLFAHALRFQQLDNRGSCSGIQPSGGLIKEQDLGHNDQLHTNVATLPATTGDPMKELIANLEKNSTLNKTAAYLWNSTDNFTALFLIVHVGPYIVL